MPSFFRNAQKEEQRDSTELLWQFQSQPDVFLNRYLRKSDLFRREALLEMTQEYSVSFAVGIVSLTGGNTHHHHDAAVKDALYRTEFSREFTDLAVACGLIDQRLESVAERVAHNRAMLKYLFQTKNSSDDGDGVVGLGYRFARANSDQDNLSDARESIFSFAQVSNQLTRYTNSFRDRSVSFDEKVVAAASLFLFLHADGQSREEIRKADVSAWIDIYDPTEIDREQIESWLRYCDPLMRAGYYSLLVRALEDPSARGTRARTVLDILENSLEKTAEFHSDGLGAQVIQELESIGVFCDIPQEVLQNSIARRCPSSLRGYESYGELQSQIRERVGIVLDIIFEVSEVSLTPTYGRKPRRILDTERGLVYSLTRQCLGEDGIFQTGSPITRDSLSVALLLTDEQKRFEALTLLSMPTEDHFNTFIQNVDDHLSVGIITSFLNTELHEQAFRWLERNPTMAQPHLHRQLSNLGFENELVAAGILSILSKSQLPNRYLVNLLEKQYKREHRPVMQHHLIRALASVQDETTAPRLLPLFIEALSEEHLVSEATKALALSGPRGIAYLESQLEGSITKSGLNIHERKTPELSPLQIRVIHALPAAGPQGGLVLLRFLNRFSDCHVTHLVTAFLREVKEPHFGLTDKQIWNRFIAYCNQ